MTPPPHQRPRPQQRRDARDARLSRPRPLQRPKTSRQRPAIRSKNVPVGNVSSEGPRPMVLVLTLIRRPAKGAIKITLPSRSSRRWEGILGRPLPVNGPALNNQDVTLFSAASSTRRCLGRANVNPPENAGRPTGAPKIALLLLLPLGHALIGGHAPIEARNAREEILILIVQTGRSFFNVFERKLALKASF